MDSDQALLLEPNEFIVFEYLPNTSSTSQIHLKNPSSSNLAYKLKTNSPVSYTVRPTQGILGPYEEKSISVTLQCTKTVPDIQKDKFLILYTKTSFPTDCPMSELSKFWQITSVKSVKSAKLSVQVVENTVNTIQHFVDFTRDEPSVVEESGTNEEKKKKEQKSILDEISRFELKMPVVANYNLKLITFVSLVLGIFYCIA